MSSPSRNMTFLGVIIIYALFVPVLAITPRKIWMQGCPNDISPVIDDPTAYIQRVHNRLQKRQCAPGSRFDPKTCICSILTDTLPSGGTVNPAGATLLPVNTLVLSGSHGNPSLSTEKSSIGSSFGSSQRYTQQKYDLFGTKQDVFKKGFMSVIDRKEVSKSNSIFNSEFNHNSYKPTLVPQIYKFYKKPTPLTLDDIITRTNSAFVIDKFVSQSIAKTSKPIVSLGERKPSNDTNSTSRRMELNEVVSRARPQIAVDDTKPSNDKNSVTSKRMELNENNSQAKPQIAVSELKNSLNVHRERLTANQLNASYLKTNNVSTNDQKINIHPQSKLNMQNTNTISAVQENKTTSNASEGTNIESNHGHPRINVSKENDTNQFFTFIQNMDRMGMPKKYLNLLKDLIKLKSDRNVSKFDEGKVLSGAKNKAIIHIKPVEKRRNDTITKQEKDKQNRDKQTKNKISTDAVKNAISSGVLISDLLNESERIKVEIVTEEANLKKQSNPFVSLLANKNVLGVTKSKLNGKIKNIQNDLVVRTSLRRGDPLNIVKVTKTTTNTPLETTHHQIQPWMRDATSPTNSQLSDNFLTDYSKHKSNPIFVVQSSLSNVPVKTMKVAKNKVKVVENQIRPWKPWSKGETKLSSRHTTKPTEFNNLERKAYDIMSSMKHMLSNYVNKKGTNKNEGLIAMQRNTQNSNNNNRKSRNLQNFINKTHRKNQPATSGKHINDIITMMTQFTMNYENQLGNVQNKGLDKGGISVQDNIQKSNLPAIKKINRQNKNKNKLDLVNQLTEQIKVFLMRETGKRSNAKSTQGNQNPDRATISSTSGVLYPAQKKNQFDLSILNNQRIKNILGSNTNGLNSFYNGRKWQNTSPFQPSTNNLGNLFRNVNSRNAEQGDLMDLIEGSTEGTRDINEHRTNVRNAGSYGNVNRKQSFLHMLGPPQNAIRNYSLGGQRQPDSAQFNNYLTKLFSNNKQKPLVENSQLTIGSTGVTTDQVFPFSRTNAGKTGQSRTFNSLPVRNNRFNQQFAW